MVPLFSGTTISSAAAYAQLADMEWCQVWEPSIGSGVSTQAEKQQLLWGYPGILWQEPAAEPLTTDAHFARLAHMEWCNVLEPGIGSGTGTQAEKQQLLWGYPGVLWQEAAAPQSAIVPASGGWSWESVRAYSEADKRRRKRLKKAEERLDAILAEVIDGPQETLPEPIVAAARPVQKAESVLDQIHALDPGVLRDIQRLLSEIGRIERSIEKARQEQLEDEDDAVFLMMVA